MPCNDTNFIAVNILLTKKIRQRKEHLDNGGEEGHPAVLDLRLPLLLLQQDRPHHLVTTDSNLGSINYWKYLAKNFPKDVHP